MDPHVLRVYVWELEEQAFLALQALHDVGTLIHKMQTGQGPNQNRMIFARLHHFCAHAAMVSKILWPGLPQKLRNEATGDYKKRVRASPAQIRGAELRDAIKLPPAAGKLKARAVRNALEHYDAELDNWVSTAGPHALSDQNIGPVGAISGMSPEDYARWLDPHTWTLYVFGKQLNLLEMKAGLEALYQRLAAKGSL